MLRTLTLVLPPILVTVGCPSAATSAKEEVQEQNRQNPNHKIDAKDNYLTDFQIQRYPPLPDANRVAHQSFAAFLLLSSAIHVPEGARYASTHDAFFSLTHHPATTWGIG